MNPVIVTYTNLPCDRLFESARDNGWTLRVLRDPGPYKGANYKFKRIISDIPFLQSEGFTHLISMDALDTIVVRDRAWFDKAMFKLGNPAVILAAETNCFPLPEMAQYYPLCNTRWQYVNSPFILNLKKEIPTEFFHIGDKDDQVHLSHFYINNYRNPEVVLDSKCEIIQTLYGVSPKTFDKDLKNTETNTYPIFFHGNGKVDMSWIQSPEDYVESKVLVCVPTAEFARRADFYDHLALLDIPAGTIRMSPHGQSPARGRNIAIEQALLADCTHILFIDDDCFVPPDTLKKLIAHNVDAVTGLYLMRNYPHQPIIFDLANDKGEARFHLIQSFPEKEGLIEVENAGLGCCLIKTDVFKKMEKPWIRLGELEKDHWCDDLGFFKRAKKEAGLRLFCDLDVRVGHQCSVVIRPSYVDGQWATEYDTAGISRVLTPQLTYEQVEAHNEMVKQLREREAGVGVS